MGFEAAMGSPRNQEPLLETKKKKKTRSVIWVLVKWILKMSIWVVFISWILLMLLFPVEWFGLGYQNWAYAGSTSFFGSAGRALLVYSSPIMIVAILATAYQIIFQGEEEEEECLQLRSEEASYRLWTFPVLVDGSLGIVSAAELIAILIFIAYLFWFIIQFTITVLEEASTTDYPIKFYYPFRVGTGFGDLGAFAMAFMFIPVARGSALLRLINVPFEHATKYHIWLGNATMIFFTLHGLAMVIAYIRNGEFKRTFTWNSDGVENIAGVIALVIGFVMWITSIGLIRRKYFEPFFYTHQLYILFVLFYAMHVGGYFFAMSAGPIFIFMLDRFLRLCQSQTTVDVISTKCHPCGVLELALAKPSDLRYNALSFVFLRIREVSWLQWHPFSVSSSPLDGKKEVSVMIKVVGEWTSKLRDQISSMGTVTASVEGPYGHELPYYLTYKYMVFVAGGIGISPFLAILRDVLHRSAQGKPRNVLLVWAVKNSNELPLYFNVKDELEPSFDDKLCLEARVFVTQETRPALEEGNNNTSVVNAHYYYNASNGRTNVISNLVGTGNGKWLLLYALSSSIGFVMIKGFLNVYYIYATDVIDWGYLGTLLLVSMVAGVVISGGLVLGLWHLRESKTHQSMAISERSYTNASEDFLIRDNASVIEYGSRPDFQGIFESLAGKWGNVDVGTIVCGPETMESGVAKACRTLNVTRERDHPIFNFHTHSFSL